MNTVAQAVVIVGLSVIATLIGQAIVRRRVRRELLSAHTDVAGFIYAALAVIYAVVLAQVVVAAWDDFQEAREAAELEGGAVLNLIRLAEEWPEAERAAVEQALVAYVRSVIDKEWPAMERGEAPAPATIARMSDVWRAYSTVEGGSVGATPRFAASLDELSRLDLARGKRLLASHDQLPAIMWATLILGGVLTIGFAYLFAVENRLIQSLMLTALAALISLLLLLAEELDTPFRGDNRIGPDVRVQVLERSGLDVSGGTSPATRRTFARYRANGRRYRDSVPYGQVVMMMGTSVRCDAATECPKGIAKRSLMRYDS